MTQFHAGSSSVEEVFGILIEKVYGSREFDVCTLVILSVEAL